MRPEDYISTSDELIAEARRVGQPVTAKCGRCYESVLKVGQTAKADEVAEKLFKHKTECSKLFKVIR